LGGSDETIFTTSPATVTAVPVVVVSTTDDLEEEEEEEAAMPAIKRTEKGTEIGKHGVQGKY